MFVNTIIVDIIKVIINEDVVMQEIKIQEENVVGALNIVKMAIVFNSKSVHIKRN